MLVYRISKKAYINDLSGIGAGLHGGRWNPKGINLLYTAGTIALAYVEFLVHNYHLLLHKPVCMASIQIPGKDHIVTFHPEDLPANWSRKDNNLTITQEIGARFVRDGKSYALQVPSAVVPGEYNLLLNPLHKDHRHTSIQMLTDPLTFDERLIRQLQGE